MTAGEPSQHAECDRSSEHRWQRTRRATPRTTHAIDERTGPAASRFPKREVGIGTSTNEPRQCQHLVERDTLAGSNGLGITADLQQYRFAQTQPLVAQLVHKVGIEFGGGCVDRLDRLKQGEWQSGIDRAPGKGELDFGSGCGAGEPAVCGQRHAKAKLTCSGSPLQAWDDLLCRSMISRTDITSADGTSLLVAVAIGVVLAGGVAFAARRAGSLTASGAVAATVVGTLAMTAGWRWGVFLIGWFVAASLLSRSGRAIKLTRTDGVVEKGDQRDAGQVLANGGVFTLAAAAAITAAIAAWPFPADVAALAAAGSLAAAGADTAATEVGTRWGKTPWSLRTHSPATPGSSGAMSLVGTFGMIVAAAVLGIYAAVIGLVAWSSALIVAYAGVCGALTDTVLGAWLQSRRWCASCAQHTEQIVHRCGNATVPDGGLSWMTNDLVNVGCAVVGGLVAVALR